MGVSSKPACRVVRSGGTYAGKPGFNYLEGSAAETVGSMGIYMHLPANLGDRPATAIIARTDPKEQESVVLPPDLERYVPR